MAVEMLLPNKERNSVVLAGETLRLVTASSPAHGVVVNTKAVYRDCCRSCMKNCVSRILT